MRYLPLRAVLICRYTSARASSSRTWWVVAVSSRSLNVEPSETTSWVSLLLSVSILGKYTSLIVPALSVYQTLLAAAPIAVPKPSLSPGDQVAAAPGYPGAGVRTSCRAPTADGAAKPTAPTTSPRVTTRAAVRRTRWVPAQRAAMTTSSDRRPRVEARSGTDKPRLSHLGP